MAEKPYSEPLEEPEVPVETFLQQQDRIRGRLRRVTTNEALGDLPPLSSTASNTISPSLSRKPQFPSSGTSSSSSSSAKSGLELGMTATSSFRTIAPAPRSVSMAEELPPSSIPMGKSAPPKVSTPSNPSSLGTDSATLKRAHSFNNYKQNETVISIRRPNEPKPQPLADFDLVEMDTIRSVLPMGLGVVHSSKLQELQKLEVELELQDHFRQHWEDEDFEFTAPRVISPREKQRGRTGSSIISLPTTTSKTSNTTGSEHIVSPRGGKDTTLSTSVSTIPPTKRKTLADLWDIVKSGQGDELTSLMEQIGDNAVVTAANQFLQTALHIAAEKGFLDIVALLISRGADVNAKDKNGWTALHSSCHAGSWAVCEYLLRQGDSSVMVISSSGATPLHYLIKCPLSDSNEKTPGYSQSVSAFKKVFNLMLEKGAMVNAQNNFGETPLHQAASLPSAVICLLENGANLSLRSMTGETPLHYACRSGNEKAVQALLDYGADPSISGHQGTPLDVARAAKLPNICALLQKKMTEIRKAPGKVHRSSSVIQKQKSRDETSDMPKLEEVNPAANRSRLKKGQSFRIQSHGFLVWNDELIDVMLRQSGRPIVRSLSMSKLPGNLEMARHMFNVKDEEPFIEDFSCHLNDSNKGTLLVFQHLVCFYSTNAAGVIESKEIVPFKDIAGIFRVGEDGLELTAKQKYLFRHFAADCQEVFSLLEFLRNNRERIGPIVFEGFPIHQMLGAIKNPYDYREFQERFYDNQRLALVASCACTLQIFDEAEGMLDIPESGKLFISQNSMTFLSVRHGSRRVRDISFTQIKEVLNQKMEPAKIQLVSGTLRYSFSNLPSMYYFDKILSIIQKTWASVQKRIHLQTVLVLGADTLIGLLAIKELTAGACVKAAFDAREPASSPAIERVRNLGAELVTIDFTDPVSIKRALLGVSRVFWVPSREDEIVWQTHAFLACAVAANIQLLVRVSSLRAHDENDAVEDTTLDNITKLAVRKLNSLINKTNPIADARGKPPPPLEDISITISPDRQAEALIESSKVPYAFLRCNMVMQHFACLPIKSQGVFHFPLEKASVSWVDTRDLAFSAAAILVSEDGKHNGKRYLLTGRESLTCDETAQILARVIAKRVQYIDVGEDEVRKSIVSSGLQNLPNINNILATYAIAREGKAKGVSPHVKQIIGQEPFTFEQFVNDHISFFKDTYRLYFSQKEQIALQSQFHNIDMAGTGNVNRTQFCNALGYIMSEIGLSDSIFNAFDYRREDVLNLKEYFTGMSVMMKGTVEEKLEFAFKMHDVNHDGYLTREEFQAIADRIQTIGFKCEEIDGLIQFVLNFIFQETIGDEARPVSKVTREEWKERALKNLRHLQSLGLLSTQMVSKEATSKERAIVFGHDSWELIFNMMLCISRSVSGIVDEPIQETLEPKEFELETSVTLSDNGEDATAWVVTEYAPRVFRQIRYLFGMDDRAFLASCGIGRSIASMLLGDITMPQEGASSGRSGSYFFKTEDKKFFMKTIAPEEDSVFRKALPSYLEHITRNPNTLLTRFLGLYKIKKGINGKEHSFVVMTNVFGDNIEIDEQYDLKGSTVGRHVSVSEDDQDTAEIALKDMNFKRKICLGPERKAQLMEQVERDCKWMASHSICDYSLLIGFAFLQDPFSGDPSSSSSKDEVGNPPSPAIGTNSSSSGTPLVTSGSTSSLVSGGSSSNLLASGSLPSIGAAGDRVSMVVSGGGIGGPGIIASPSGGGIPITFPRKESIFKQHQGGILSVDKNVIYFIGIIDNITPYNYKKMGEYLFKRLLHDKNKISAIPPDRYRSRFQAYVASIVE